MSQKITITQALSELKMINKRLSALVDPIGSSHKSKHIILLSGRDPKKIKTLTDQLNSAHQSRLDLMKREALLRRAVAQSNAVTVVRVGKNEMTVAEAIERKNHWVPRQTSLLQSLKSELSYATAWHEREQEKYSRMVNERISSLTPKDASASPELIKTVEESLSMSLEPVMVNHENVSAMIAQLEEEIEDFRLNVDVALSISNARTEVEI
jgi:hypothetical protein